MSALFLKNVWQVAAFSREIVPGAPFARTLCNLPLVMYRTRAGKLVAMDDRCAHRNSPLSLGKIVGDHLQCGYHGACFDATGACVSVPGQKVVSIHAKVPTYPIVERHKLAWIWLGEAAKADASLIPDISWMESPMWVCSEGYTLVAAHYQLLIDNLLDLSHETYVHGKTIGHDAVAESPVSVEETATHLIVKKEMLNCTPPPFYQHAARLGPNDPVDRWQRTTFTPPAICVIDVGVNPLPPVREGAVRVGGQVINLITPESDTTSHYFWAFARDCRLDEPALTEYLRAAVEATFAEDEVMLEGQQKRVNHPTAPTFNVAFKTDIAPTRARKMVARMLGAERDEPNLQAAD
jgi:phenylpropionate dioxygenase-like ring-hydroxylating dioxygenase large terminal subunit